MTNGPAGMRTGPVIAIDGPGGSGKSTVAREIARRLGLRYLDTGALYRAVTAAVLDRDIALTDDAAIAAVAAATGVVVNTDPDDPWTEIDGVRVTERIRSRAVTNAVSAVSAVRAVRAHLLTVQRAAVGAGGIVVEGRDIGTTVVPDAEVKVFLTAAPAARAARRHRDADAPEHDDFSRTHDEMSRRDRLDASRAESPLARAEDAIEIDTTELSIEEVVREILGHCPTSATAGTDRAGADA